MPGVSFLARQTVEVFGRKMAYAEMGEGPPILFQHGNPTSSYLWRNIAPKLAPYGRCIAVDLIGMGGSDKLPDSGPGRYSFAEHCEYLFHAWDQLEVYKDAILVLHDWGSALGFEWARQHPNRCEGIAYMEAIVAPIASWDDWPAEARKIFQAMRSPAGEEMVLERNLYVERILPAATLGGVGSGAMAHYREPFREPGEGRRPVLDWPRQLPIAGEPADMVAAVRKYADWMAVNDLPKLFIDANPGSILVGPQRDFCLAWKNQQVARVKGSHFVPEDSPDAVADALVSFVSRLRR